MFNDNIENFLKKIWDGTVNLVGSLMVIGATIAAFAAPYMAIAAGAIAGLLARALEKEFDLPEGVLTGDIEALIALLKETYDL